MERAAAPLGLIFAGFLAAAAPPAERKLEGLYRLDMRETASMLKLDAEGHFEWFFSQGALDVGTQGRWRREGDKLLLMSEPPPETIVCCIAHFKDLPVAILPDALEMELPGGKLRYQSQSKSE